MKNKILLFDLDSTLYYVGNEVQKLCDNNVVRYLVKNMNISEEEANELIKKFRESYCYDSEAIAEEYRFNQKEFVEFVCDIPTDVIPQDKELEKILKKIPNPKYIVTDSTTKHTKDVLKKMEVDYKNFIYIYDAHDMNYIFKYRKECLAKFLSKFNFKASDCVIFEDNVKNLEVAKNHGMVTVYIKPNEPEKPQYVDYMFPDIKGALVKLF